MRGADRYSALSADSILTTLARLGGRVRGRFPDRGLTGVRAELDRIAQMHVKRVGEVSRPHLLLCGLVALVLIAGLFMVGVGIEQKVRLLMENPDEIGFEGIEAIDNILILMGAAIWFLLNLETRIKRSQALNALHELRSIAHVIDMHQLTGKLAALCMQSVRDEVVIHTVNKIEGLTTNLSSKIWQKIMIIRSEIDLPVPK